MKNTKCAFHVLVVVASFFTNCANDETAIPKLVCSQPDFVVNKSVEAIQATAGAIVAKYAYDDIIEAYVVSSDVTTGQSLDRNIVEGATIG